MTAVPDSEKEARILKAMRLTLTGVIKDTATAPGHRHPLSDTTIEDIRQCLALIAARERELVEAAGGRQSQRPHFTDEPKSSVAVPVGKIGRSGKRSDEDGSGN